MPTKMILKYVKFIVSVFFLFYMALSLIFLFSISHKSVSVFSLILSPQRNCKDFHIYLDYSSTVRILNSLIFHYSLLYEFYLPNLIFYHTSPILALVLFLEYTNLVSLCLCLSLSKYFIWLIPLTFHNSAQILLLRDFLPTQMESAFYSPTLHSLALHFIFFMHLHVCLLIVLW